MLLVSKGKNRVTGRLVGNIAAMAIFGCGLCSYTECARKILRTRRNCWSPRKFRHGYADSLMVVNYEENVSGFQLKESNFLIHTRTAWFMDVRERLLEFYSV